MSFDQIEHWAKIWPARPAGEDLQAASAYFAKVCFMRVEYTIYPDLPEVVRRVITPNSLHTRLKTGDRERGIEQYTNEGAT